MISYQDLVKITNSIVADRDEDLNTAASRL